MTSARAIAACALLALGCARDPEPAAASGLACEHDTDCNRLPDGGTATCGYLRLCIAGRCEVAQDAGSNLVVCRDR